MKKLSFLFVAMMVCAFSFAENKTITIKADAGILSSYPKDSARTLSVDGNKFMYEGIMYNAKNSPTGCAVKQFMQLRNSGKGAGKIWNTTPIKNIVKVTVTTQNDKDFIIRYGNEANPTADSIVKADVTGSDVSVSYSTTTGETNATMKQYVFDVKGAQYFSVVNGSGASYFSSIVIEYGESTPVDTTSVDTTIVDTTIVTPITYKNLAEAVNGKTIRRAIYNNGSFYILALAGDTASTLLKVNAKTSAIETVYDVDTLAAVHPYSSTTSGINSLPLADIALTEDGTLIGAAADWMTFEPVNPFKVYKWNDKGERTLWISELGSAFAGNCNNAIAAVSIAYKGTIENGTLAFVTNSVTSKEYRIAYADIKEGAFEGAIFNRTADLGFITSDNLGTSPLINYINSNVLFSGKAAIISPFSLTRIDNDGHLAAADCVKMPELFQGAYNLTVCDSLLIMPAERHIYVANVANGLNNAVIADSVETTLSFPFCGMEINGDDVTIYAIAKDTVLVYTYSTKKIYTIANTKETAYTVAQARELVNAGEDLATRVYVKGVVSTIVTTAENVAKYKNFDAYIKDPETDGSVSFELYHCLGLDSAAVETLPIALNDTVIAYGAMTKHNDTYEFSKNCYLVEIRPCTIEKKDISNTAETAYTVSEAIDLINDPASDLTKEVYVKGTVTGEVSIDTGDNGNATFDITDGTKTMTMFRVFDINNAKFTSEDAVQEGDQVVMIGIMKNFNGAMELNPGRIYEINHVNDALENISANDAAKKVMINGQLYIIRNEEIFTIMGQNVK